MPEQTNRRIVLDARPEGIPQPEHFRRDDQPVPEPGDGEFLLRNHYLSIDPAQRGWVNAAANYSAPVPIGGAMRSLAVGQVTASRHPEVAEGEYLYGWFGWQDYCVAGPDKIIRRVDPEQAPVSAALGILGIGGVAAYLSLTGIGNPQPGETVVVSTAAGSVGSVAGQVAKQLECRAVGITGSDEKVAACTESFGYDAAVNYRTAEDIGATVSAHCPNGVDVFFDNTSGAIADAMVLLMNVGGRIIQCGTASIANWSPTPSAPRRDREMLTRRLRHQGFVIFDHVGQEFDAAVEQLATWIRQGAIEYHEDVESELDRAPAALAGLYNGVNRGKKIVRLI